MVKTETVKTTTEKTTTEKTETVIRQPVRMATEKWAMGKKGNG